MKNIIFSLVLIPNLLFSIDLNTTQETTYIDELHEIISKRVEDLSLIADDFLVVTVDTTSAMINDKNTTNQKESNSVDALFQNQKYMDERKKSFLKLSVEARNQSIGDDGFKVNLSASLALSKSNKRFKLFMDGITQNNIGNMLKKTEYTEDRPEIGLSLEESLGKKTDMKYSVGIRGFSPFVKAMLLYKTGTENWKIEPSQTIEYSLTDGYREYTKLYMDKEIIEKVLFRITLERGTRDRNEGMDYSGGVSLFWTPEKKVGVELSQHIYGNTKYIYEDTVSGNSEIYSDINKYITEITLRRNIYRRWFFYEISPAVSFSKANNFEANYIIFAKIDLFFGKI